jgi:hypothetical protein
MEDTLGAADVIVSKDRTVNGAKTRDENMMVTRGTLADGAKDEIF